MGSATREALASAKKALDALGGKDGLALGEQLFEASRVIDGSSQLRSALADPAVPAAEKSQVSGAPASSSRRSRPGRSGRAEASG